MDEIPPDELRRHRVQVLIIFLPMALALVVLLVAIVRAVR